MTKFVSSAPLIPFYIQKCNLQISRLLNSVKVLVFNVRIKFNNLFSRLRNYYYRLMAINLAVDLEKCRKTLWYKRLFSFFWLIFFLLLFCFLFFLVLFQLQCVLQ